MATLLPRCPILSKRNIPIARKNVNIQSRARVSPYTSCTPAPLSTSAHRFSVAPVVNTSSRSTTDGGTLPSGKQCLRVSCFKKKAFFRFSSLCCLLKSFCSFVPFDLPSRGTTCTGPRRESSLLINPMGSNPRCFNPSGRGGTGRRRSRENCSSHTGKRSSAKKRLNLWNPLDLYARIASFT